MSKDEREAAKKLRAERKERNDKLTHIDSDGKKYGTDKSGKTFYYGIRDYDVVRIFHKTEPRPQS